MSVQANIKPDEAMPVRIFNATFISVFIANMLLQLGHQMMNTLVAKYANSLGASASTVGIVVSMFAYSALLFKIISGPAIDSFSRKWVLIIAMLTMAASYFGYSMSDTIQKLMVFRLLQGAGQAFTATCCLALASDALPPEKMATGIGYFSLAQAACQAVGPTIGLSLSKAIGYSNTFMAGGFLMMTAAFAATQIRQKQTIRKRFKISVKSIVAKEAIMPAVIMFFLVLAFSNINSFLVIYAGERGADGNIGLFFTVYALTLLFTRPMIGKLSDKYGLVKTLIPAMCCFGLAFLLISFSASLPMFLLSAFVSAFGYGACQPAVQTLCMKCVPPDRRGAGSSTNYIGADLGQLLGPTIAGAVVEQAGYSSMWRIMIIPIFAAILMVILNRNTIAHAGEEFLK